MVLVHGEWGVGSGECGMGNGNARSKNGVRTGPAPITNVSTVISLSVAEPFVLAGSRPRDDLRLKAIVAGD